MCFFPCGDGLSVIEGWRRAHRGSGVDVGCRMDVDVTCGTVEKKTIEKIWLQNEFQSSRSWRRAVNLTTYFGPPFLI